MGVSLGPMRFIPSQGLMVGSVRVSMLPEKAVPGVHHGGASTGVRDSSVSWRKAGVHCGGGVGPGFRLATTSEVGTSCSRRRHRRTWDFDSLGGFTGTDRCVVTPTDCVCMSRIARTTPFLSREMVETGWASSVASLPRFRWRHEKRRAAQCL